MSWTMGLRSTVDSVSIANAKGNSADWSRGVAEFNSNGVDFR